MCQSWDGLRRLCSFSSLAPPGLLGASASDSSKTAGGAGAEQGGLNLTGCPSVLVPSAFWPEGACVACPFFIEANLGSGPATLSLILSAGAPMWPPKSLVSAPGAPWTSHRTRDSRPLPPPAQHPSRGRAPLSTRHLWVSWTSPSCVLLAQPR